MCWGPHSAASLLTESLSSVAFSPASGSARPHTRKSSTLADCLAIPLSLELPLADGCLLPVPDHLPASTCPSSTALTTPIWLLVPASCREKKPLRSESPPVCVQPLPCTMSSDSPNYRLEADVTISPIFGRDSGAGRLNNSPQSLIVSKKQSEDGSPRL